MSFSKVQTVYGSKKKKKNASKAAGFYTYIHIVQARTKDAKDKMKEKTTGDVGEKSKKKSAREKI